MKFRMLLDIRVIAIIPYYVQDKVEIEINRVQN